MEKVVIVINGTYAKEKAEAIRQLVTEQIAANNITETSVYIEKQLQVMPFMSAERSGTYDEQIRGSLRNGPKSRND